MMARVLRHLLVAPAFLILVLAVVVVSPLILAVAAIVSLLVDRRWRPLRCAVFVLLYLVHDALAVLAGFGLWLRLAGTGRMRGEAMQTRHYALLEWLLTRLSCGAARILVVTVEVQGSEALTALSALDRPLIVLSRHAGPGDSFLLVGVLLTHGRRPRIVLRSALQLDPGIDLLGSRLPFCWVNKNSGGSAQACQRITSIAAEMDGRGALLLFPEGGNFTHARRRGSIRRLLRQGLRRRARQAADMQHLVAPRPGGALAALAGARDASVVFVAHSGLAGMSAGLLHRIPTDRTLRVQMWLVPPAQIPAAEEARTEWLFQWWQRLDEWVEANADPGGSLPAVAASEPA
jgi:1-acyl-sn-glycerol-3-phosphate acyltransferase